MFGLSQGILVTSFLLVVEYHKTFVGVFVSSYTLSESKCDLHCAWPQGPAMANLTLFPFLLCIKTVFPAMQKTKSNFEVAYLCFNCIFENLSNSLFLKAFKVCMILVHNSANFTIHIFFYCFTGFTPLVGFLDVICSSVGFAYHVNGSWF